jgi:hypothetical protein
LSRNCPPSEKLSGVTLRMPMTRAGRAQHALATADRGMALAQIGPLRASLCGERIGQGGNRGRNIAAPKTWRETILPSWRTSKAKRLAQARPPARRTASPSSPAGFQSGRWGEGRQWSCRSPYPDQSSTASR